IDATRSLRSIISSSRWSTGQRQRVYSGQLRFWLDKSRLLLVASAAPSSPTSAANCVRATECPSARRLKSFGHSQTFGHIQCMATGLAFGPAHVVLAQEPSERVFQGNHLTCLPPGSPFHNGPPYGGVDPHSQSIASYTCVYAEIRTARIIVTPDDRAKR